MTATGMAGGFTPVNIVPLRVRTGGARLEQRMQGWQHAWLQTSQGRWWAVVSVRVSSANEQSHASIPADGRRRRDPPRRTVDDEG
ncbi:hypothetical protein [Gordonia hongkongensis]|uniref:hypothetical protein n=1 Tax=Gordonia hongkongensis TaxID=1701090 RepID=UPI001FF84033|nr:hypothetical protein [Gordonia hongkongensis]UPG70819.1 hypothetical protein MVF96_24330 [Gordonia hongkongensis]